MPATTRIIPVVVVREFPATTVVWSTVVWSATTRIIPVVVVRGYVERKLQGPARFSRASEGPLGTG